MRQNPKRHARNRYHVSRARTFIKGAREAIEAGKESDAREATLTAIRALDKAAEKGVIHKNNAARRKSRLMKSLNKLAQ
jgi:small subunit ribosomal protein S20